MLLSINCKDAKVSDEVLEEVQGKPTDVKQKLIHS